MLEVGLIQIFIIVIGIIIGFLMIDTERSGITRKAIEDQVLRFPHPSEVNSIPKLIAYISKKWNK